MGPLELSHFVKQLAAEAGLDRCGIASADRDLRGDYLRTWLATGRAGSMEYLHGHFDKRVNPGRLLEGAHSVIAVALLYHQPRPPPEGRVGDRGRVARYAWGDDYHDVVKKKLFGIVDRLREALTEPFDCKVCVDTAPLLEREVAAAAGIGWIGKNTMVLHPKLGSYFFLGAIVTTLELAFDEPVPDHCGTCTACLTACPTDAFPAPYQMDASRCISYLTIEHRDAIADDLAAKMGDWIFGCDICQEVCPHNRRAPTTREPRFTVRSPGPTPSLDDILGWTEDTYREKLRGSAMKRASLEMLQRNARIAKSDHPPHVK